MSSVTLIINYGLTYFDKFMDMTVDSIGQCNNHVKTCGCRGSLDKAHIYSTGKSVFLTGGRAGSALVR